MRSVINTLLLIAGCAVVLCSCEKAKELPYYQLGSASTLTTNTAALTLQNSDSAKNVLTLNWTFPHYATDSANMKYVVEIDSAGKNFAGKVTRTLTKNLSTSFTGKDLNTILLNKGYALGVAVTFDLRIMSSYANNNEKYISNVVNVTVASYGTPSALTTSETSVSGTLATANDTSNTFSWSEAIFPPNAGIVNYTLQYDLEGGGFVAPQEIPVGNSILAQVMTVGAMNETALKSGIPMGTTGTVEYRVKALFSTGSVAYSNVVTVTIQTYIPVLRFYLPGSYQGSTGNGTDWTPGDAPELIRDLRSAVFNSLYYIYIYLPAGAEFKVTQGRSWDVNYGGTGGTLTANGANFSVGAAGVYRISIDVNNMKYDIREGRMGFVGSAVQPVDWNPDQVFPTSSMNVFFGTNKFFGLYTFSAGGWKMIDNDAWNNGSNAVDETRSYGSNGASGSTMEVNGPNFPDITTPDTYRVIWDGTDVDNIKYEMYHGLRVVGGFQGWDPATATPMTYSGDGKWTIDITLPAGEFKFVSADGWAFNYGGSGGTISRDGPNLSVAGGTYTITVDEYFGTYTIL